MVAMNRKRDVMSRAELIEQQRKTVAPLVAELAAGEHLARVPIIGELAGSMLPVWVVVRVVIDGMNCVLVAVATKLTDRYVVVRLMYWDEGRVKLTEGTVVPLLEVERMATEADMRMMELKFGAGVVRATAGVANAGVKA